MSEGGEIFGVGGVFEKMEKVGSDQFFVASGYRWKSGDGAVVTVKIGGVTPDVGFFFAPLRIEIGDVAGEG